MRLAVALSLIGSAAYAECPTAADLVSGVRLEWSNGDVTTIQPTDDPVIVSVRTDWPSGAHKVERVAWGLYTVEETEVEGTELDLPGSVDYGVEPQQLPRPLAGSEVRFAKVFYNYHWLFAQQETYQMGSSGTVTLAGCPYRAFEVTLVQTDVPFDGPLGAPKIAKGWAYLTDLGFAVASWFGPPEDHHLAPDVVSIRAVR